MQVILEAFTHTLVQFAALFGMLLIGGIALTIISKRTSRTFQSFVFPRFGLYVFGSIGIPFHELCHVVFCKLFGHEIQHIRWFDPNGKGDAFGAVTHSYNPRNIYHRMGHFFIGLGPTILAPVALALLFNWLVPGGKTFDAFSSTTASGVVEGFFRALFHAVNFTSYGFYLFLYLAICISSQVELSQEDLDQVKLGILPILLCLLGFNLIAGLLNLHWHEHMLAWGWRFMIFSGCLFAFAVTIALLNLLVCAAVFETINWARQPS